MTMLAEKPDGGEPDNPFDLRTCIQKVATGPEYSKDLSYEESYAGMRDILDDSADPVQAGVYLVALRMKRETDAENKGSLQAIIDKSEIVTADVDELIDVADPYDGYTRGLPATPFLAPVLAACGVPAICHGLESVGPKFGITHRTVLTAAGINPDATPQQAANAIANPDIRWGYVDQRQFCPALHGLVGLRTRIVKRPVITTVEVLVGPVRAKKQTHLLTGYVHKAYPPIYAELARFAGFDSALIVRGVEGGVIPSLKQKARIFHYHDMGAEDFFEVEPEQLGISQPTRAVPLPADLPAVQENADIAAEINVAEASGIAAELGLQALQGKSGATYDSLVYTAAMCLKHIGRNDTLADAADAVRKVLDSGKALSHFKAAQTNL